MAMTTLAIDAHHSRSSIGHTYLFQNFGGLLLAGILKWFLEGFCTHFSSNLALLGSILASSWLQLGPTWPTLAPTCPSLAPSWPFLAPFGGQVGPKLVPSWSQVGHFASQVASFICYFANMQKNIAKTHVFFIFF